MRPSLIRAVKSKTFLTPLNKRLCNKLCKIFVEKVILQVKAYVHRLCQEALLAVHAKQ